MARLLQIMDPYKMGIQVVAKGHRRAYRIERTGEVGRGAQLQAGVAVLEKSVMGTSEDKQEDKFLDSK